jgi:hypothetical protein
MKLRNYCVNAAMAVFFLSFSINNVFSQTINLTSGSSWTVPADVVRIRVECWGAGGGGSFVSTGMGGGAGGGGAYASVQLCVTPNSSINYSLGNGGSGASGTNHGGDTWFLNSTTARAQGGRGVADNTVAGGAGGSVAGSIGTTVFAGGNGGNGSTSTNWACGRYSAGGGGGGAARSTSGGGNGSNGVSASGGFLCLGSYGTGGGGGTSIAPGGAGGNGANDANNSGTNGSTYGGGGGGACRDGAGTGLNGGNGANGFIRITVLETASVAPTGITGTTTICSGSSTTLTVSGGTVGSGAVVQWFTGSCGGTSAGTGNSITVSPTSTTTYFVRYSGTCNTTTCASVTVTVNTLSVAPAGITGTTTICSGSSTTLTVSGGTIGSGAAVQWFTGSCGGTSAGTVNSITISPGSTTTYFVRYNGTCNTTSCASVTVTVNTLSTPITTLSNPGTICPNTNTSLTASGGVAGSGSTINWYTGPNGTGTLVGTGTIVTVAPTTNTTYYVRREGTCNNTADASVTINLKNYVYAATGTTSNTYCTDNAGWNHFFSGDEIIFSLQGDISSAPAGFPVASIADNGTYYQETEGPATAAGCASNQNPGEERFEMERSWNVDLGGGTPIGTYNIRFYFQPSERTAIEVAAATWIATYPDCAYTYKYATPNGFYWFKNSGSNYVAPMFEDVQYTSTPGTTSNGVNYAQWTGITGFSGGSGGIILVPIDVLPVELTSFTALCNSTNDEVSVRWTTATEHNSSHFNVERSIDGSSWDLMATTNAAGNSTITQVYEVKDYDVRAYETIYYRLQQFDQDGASKQYGPVSVSCSDNSNDWMVFPNPAGNEVTIVLKGDYAAESTQIHITDINGKSMQVIQHEQGQLITVDLRAYAPGVYIVRLVDGENSDKFVRLVKQ